MLECVRAPRSVKGISERSRFFSFFLFLFRFVPRSSLSSLAGESWLGLFGGDLVKRPSLVVGNVLNLIRDTIDQPPPGESLSRIIIIGTKPTTTTFVLLLLLLELLPHNKTKRQQACHCCQVQTRSRVLAAGHFPFKCNRMLSVCTT